MRASGVQRSLDRKPNARSSIKMIAVILGALKTLKDRSPFEFSMGFVDVALISLILSHPLPRKEIWKCWHRNCQMLSTGGECGPGIPCFVESESWSRVFLGVFHDALPLSPEHLSLMLRHRSPKTLYNLADESGWRASLPFFHCVLNSKEAAARAPRVNLWAKLGPVLVTLLRRCCRHQPSLPAARSGWSQGQSHLR